MKLAVGGLVRDRIPELRIYLRHLSAIEWDDREWLFVLDNCGEEAEALVVEAFPTASTVAVRDGAAAYDRESGRRAYRHMAALRAVLHRAAIDLDTDGLLSIDSDIVAVPDLARRLVEVDRPWVAAIVDNSRGARDAFNVMWRRDDGRFERRPLDVERGGPADLIGAVCFYRRDLLDLVEYPRPTSELLSEDTVFSIAASLAGVGGWYVPVELEHLMTRRQTEAHERGCTRCQDRDVINYEEEAATWTR